MKMIDLICADCGKEFQKEKREYNRQIKNGNNRFFCSLTCVAFTRNKENPPKGNVKNFDPIRGKRKDEYSSFRWFILRTKARSKRKKVSFNLDPFFLKELWEKQKGICPLTGWKLILHNDNRYAWKNKSIQNASLDRIDSSKGYIQDNVRFVALIANYAKQSFTDKELTEFCNSVTEYLKCPSKEMT